MIKYTGESTVGPKSSKIIETIEPTPVVYSILEVSPVLNSEDVAEEEDSVAYSEAMDQNFSGLLHQQESEELMLA